MDLRYAFWNNKGGTGKTSLAFQAICGYAEKHQSRRCTERRPALWNRCSRASSGKSIARRVASRSALTTLALPVFASMCYRTWDAVMVPLWDV